MYIYIYIYMYTYIQFLDAINHSPISPWRNLHFFQLTLEPFLRRLAPLAAASWTITGWWYTYPSEKYVFVSWDDEIPKIYGKIWKNKSHVPSHQPDSLYLVNCLGLLTISYTNYQSGFSHDQRLTVNHQLATLLLLAVECLENMKPCRGGEMCPKSIAKICH